MGIRDIWVRIRILGSVPLTNGSVDLALDQAPDSDPTSFFSDFKDAKKKCFRIFSYNLPAGKLLCQNFILQGSGDRSVLLTNGSASGRPKNTRILRIRIWIHNTASLPRKTQNYQYMTLFFCQLMEAYINQSPHKKDL